jgi:histidine kinase
MNRLSTRLLLSHLLVALLAVGATYLTVRNLAPALFDESLRRAGRGSGTGQQAGLRDTVTAAVDTSLLVGSLIGAAAAAAAGSVAAYRLLRPLGRVRRAARRLAEGHYDTSVAPPREVELAALADDVNALARRLESTEGRRVRLLGEVAHEMRTPLTVIEGYVEGIADGVFPADEQRLAQIAGEVHRLRRLSEDLSSLSRAEEGRLELEPVRLDLAEVAAEAVERIRERAALAGLQLEVSARPAVVRADRLRLGQVLTNLLGNAVRATPPGGRIVVTTGTEGGDAVLSVGDTGEGLAAEDLERVFERFYRVEGRRRAAEDAGMGVGLTIARGIVEASGGTLTAASAGRGRGAVFTVRLPLRQDDQS